MYISGTAFPWKEIFINIVALLVALLGTLSIFAFLGWNPREELPEDQQQLSYLETFILIFVALVFASYICFMCAPIKDGIVTGFIYAVFFNLIFQYKVSQNKKK